MSGSFIEGLIHKHKNTGFSSHAQFELVHELNRFINIQMQANNHFFLDEVSKIAAISLDYRSFPQKQYQYVHYLNKFHLMQYQYVDYLTKSLLLQMKSLWENEAKEICFALTCDPQPRSRLMELVQNGRSQLCG